MDKELQNLYKYNYKHLNSLKNCEKKSSDYNHTLNNFLGELYENYVYEQYKEMYKNNSEVKYILKGPYIHDKIRKIKTGFGYNNKNEIYYFSNGETIAEFDILVVGKRLVKFYEVTRSNSKPNAKNLEQEIERKKTLLQILFSRNVECEIITGNNISVYDKICFTNHIEIPVPDLNLLNYRFEKIIENNNNCININNIKYNQFDYFDTIDQLYHKYLNSKNIIDYYDICTSKYYGLIERLYLGKKNENIYYLEIYPKKTNIELSKIIYKKNKYYEIKNDSLRAIPGIKRKVKDIKKLKNKLGIVKPAYLKKVIKNLNAHITKP